MPTRRPTLADFPASTVIVTPSSPPRPPSNIVLFLHGLGDTADSFSAFSRALNLPNALCVTLQGHMALPFDLGGYHWGDDILFDQATGAMDFDAGFRSSTRMIADIIRHVFIQKCGYSGRDILVFGFGQGGMAAVASAAASSLIDVPLGGVISVGGPFPVSSSSSSSSSTGDPRSDDRTGNHNAAVAKSKTPVLVLGGSSESLVGKPAVMERFKDAFEDVQYHKWRKVGDSMPRNSQEALPIMQFFARRLRQGAPSGTVEIS